ncbi:MAG TPA: LamB/YcsF family protein [Candidatus Corynebacterium avicola]|uniref:LamB/YcsF family protein n=1 Tax=Candidatus Corynebacterium avicola TaxID=2838527 RepID=A0A9D1RPD0_9CORY|nr:LamB/YcsF family protein [Candidatus Corynebacterium avicola]
MSVIDLNADLGETTNGIAVADDNAMVQLVTSANVATGFHAGEPHTIAATVRAAADRGVSVGAHIGYNDPVNFGRTNIDIDPDQLADEVLYQIGALDALARRYGTQVTYVKPHGAMYNTIVHHAEQAHAVIDGIHAFSTGIPVMLLPGGVAVDVAEAKGLRVIREAFADRNYNPDGTLVSRTESNAVVTDPEFVAARVRQVAETGSITAVDGSVVKVDAESVCVHGDSPDSVALTRSIVEALRADGIEIKSFL